MTPTGRGVVLAFRYFALIGVGLSFVGLALAVGLRIYSRIMRGSISSADGMLDVMDAMKEAGVTFLLACILFVLCELVLAKKVRQADEE